MSSAGKCPQEHEWRENEARPGHAEAFKISIWIFYDPFQLNFELRPPKLPKLRTTLYTTQLDSNMLIWLLILSNYRACYVTLPSLLAPPYLPEVLQVPLLCTTTRANWSTITRQLKERLNQSHQMVALGHLKYELGEIQSREGWLMSLHSNMMQWE